MTIQNNQQMLMWMQEHAPELFASIEEDAVLYGENRGGAAFGFIDENDDIWMVTAVTNEHHPSRFGRANDNYDGSAALKLRTELRQMSDTTTLPKDRLPLDAVHEGAVVRFSYEMSYWVGVAYSGHEGIEDKQLAAKALKEFFDLD